MQINYINIIQNILLFQFSYYLFNFIFQLYNKKKFYILSSYFISFIHCIYTIYYAMYFLKNILNCSFEEKLNINHNNKNLCYYESINIIKSLNIFIGYLIYDLINVLYNYPLLGKFDIIFHHILYLVILIIIYKFEILMFIYIIALITSKISTVFLNISYFLKVFNIKNNFINICFILSFFIFRIINWNIGIYYIIKYYDFYLKGLNNIKILLILLICIGHLLNINWFINILQIIYKKLSQKN